MLLTFHAHPSSSTTTITAVFLPRRSKVRWGKRISIRKLSSLTTVQRMIPAMSSIGTKTESQRFSKTTVAKDLHTTLDLSPALAT